MFAAMVSEKRKLSSNAAPTWLRSDCRVTSPHVVAVDEHLALVRVEQPVDQPGDRRLAAAAGADERHAFAGAEVEVEPVEDRLLSRSRSRTPRSSISPRSSGSSTASGSSAICGSRSSSWKIRSTPARACWPTVRTPASWRAGATNCPTYVEKARKVPIVIWSWSAIQPPSASTATWARTGIASSSGW